MKRIPDFSGVQIKTVQWNNSCCINILLLKDCDSNFEVNIFFFNWHQKSYMSVKLLVIVIIVFKSYPSTYCLMQGSCFVCNYNQIRIRTVNKEAYIMSRFFISKGHYSVITFSS